MTNLKLFQAKGSPARDFLFNPRENGTENSWMEEFKKRQELPSLSRAVTVALIDKILIHDGDCVEIIYRWQDEFAWQLDVLRLAQIQEAV